MASPGAEAAGFQSSFDRRLNKSKMKSFVYYAGRKVSKANCCGYFIHVLTAGTTTPEEIHFDVIWVNVYIYFLDFW